ncbi:hypothetical protein CB1_000515005 [Camelus ferus]|nr:hypothetical protein CB1_000515005 [Camelus ferus]
MCVEISLKTSEGDSMELEIWCLEMNEKIYFGEVQLNGLGEGFQTVRVGTVGTPVGTITLSCAYRINLAFMSTRHFERTPPIMGIIIDHFVDRPYPSSSPMHPCNYRTTSEDTGVTYPSVEDSQEVCTTSFSTSPPSQCVFTVTKAHFQTPPPVVTDTLRVPMAGLAFSHQLSSSRLSYQPAALGVGSADLAYPVVFAAGLNATHPHQVTLTSLDIPFAMFAPKNLELEDADPMVNPPDSPETTSPLQGSLLSDGSSGGSSGNTQDDFVMIDFDSLPEKLAVHEKNVREFDAFVETLQ